MYGKEKHYIIQQKKSMTNITYILKKLFRNEKILLFFAVITQRRGF